MDTLKRMDRVCLFQLSATYQSSQKTFHGLVQAAKHVRELLARADKRGLGVATSAHVRKELAARTPTTEWCEDTTQRYCDCNKPTGSTTWPELKQFRS